MENNRNSGLKKWLELFKQAGFLVTLRHFFWRLICQPWLPFNNERRNWALRKLAGFFSLLGVKSLKVSTNFQTMYIDPRDYWTLRSFYFNPFYDFEQMRLVQEKIPKDYEFIDVGANFGVWSFTLADHFKKVVAFEMDKKCNACAALTLKQKKYAHVQWATCALSDQDGETVIYPSKTGFADSRIYNPGDENHEQGETIKIMSLKTAKEIFNLKFEKTFIKLDVQGVEPLVLKSLTQVVDQARDIFVSVEIQSYMLESAGFKVDDVLNLFKEMGFGPINFFDDFKPIPWKDFLVDPKIGRDYVFRLLKEETNSSTYSSKQAETALS